MRRLTAVLLALGLAGPALAEDCTAGAGRLAFAATDTALSAGQRTALDVPGGWTLTFDPVASGWDVQLRDWNGLDLSAGGVPRFGIDPRALHGWHFRNAANSGPNTGDVNAPQVLRQFLFDPRLAGTAGLKPSGGAAPAPDPEQGRARIEITEMALTPVGQGARAGFLSARVDICLNWPDPSRADPLAALVACGLDLARWSPAATLDPPGLVGGFGTGPAADAALIVTGRATGQIALALCLDGSDLRLVPDDGTLVAGGLLARAEVLRSLPGDHGALGYYGEPDWPNPEGEVIVIERIEKSIDLVFRKGGDWQAQRVYGLVTDEK
ncbi:hypothetical protein [Pseudooceanicola sp.]|uniref:hypothetical protein n=1 Tax=Pseudooceanicola sp. TaxID=1914328 RepID=UPI00262F6C51|nr:hypothetical protein [Pseudooceanicola sp.]MDF1856016.1 hypothetical protein [Pseudooceanicola sp.]